MRPPLALTMGDPAGIGPEITLKAWAALRQHSDKAFFVIGPHDYYASVASQMGLGKPHNLTDLKDVAKLFEGGLPVMDTGPSEVVSGQPNTAHADSITGSITKAVSLSQAGQAAGVVTNPIAKKVLYDAGFRFPGHTEFLAHLCESGTNAPLVPVMMLANDKLKVALATIHMPLKDVPSALTTDLVIRIADIVNTDMQTRFGLPAPRIALCGLNPHAGEGGGLGTEDADIINPAAQALRVRGIHISDARPADTLFHAEAREGYDVAIAMYHDQGLIPVKTLDFHGGVNVTLGLPIIRTSPDHGTAFDIAGLGTARPDSLLAAIKMAAQMADRASCV